MALEMTVSGRGDVLVVTCSGSIGAGQDCARFDAFMAEAARDAWGLVVNLAAVSHIDSSGLGALIRVSTGLGSDDTPVAFACPTPHVAHILRMTRIDTLLSVYDDEAAAQRRVGEQRARREQGFTSDVMCLEPGRDMLVALTSMLSAAGFTVRGCQSAYDARSLVKYSPPKLLVLGPGVDEVQRQSLREVFTGAVLPVSASFASDDPGMASAELVAKARAAVDSSA
jgi:anti-anti-sigma factor